jgi:hypothetical protein
VADMRIGAEWVDALEQYMEGLYSTSQQAASRAATYLQEQTVSQARADQDWSEVADQIEIWSRDGLLWVGIEDEAWTTRAFGIEYGDEQNPPNSLFRTMQGTAEGMSKIMDDTFRSNYGERY